MPLPLVSRRALWAACAFGVCTAAAAAAPLQAPFAPRAPLAGTAAPASDCPAAPPAVVALSVMSKYGDDGPLRDTVDTAAEATMQREVAPLRAYSRGVVARANRYSRTGQRSDADCALAWLHTWAQGRALTRIDGANAQSERGNLLAALSLALLQIQPAVLHGPSHAAVVAWMHALAQATQGYFDATRDSRKGSRNNHRYWAALGVAGTAVATDNRALLDWSARTYRQAVCGASATGALPLEMARGRQARAYHLYALGALVPLAATLQRNGIEAGTVCDGALHRIVRFTLDALDDPAALATLAGKAQAPLPGGAAPKNQLAFLEAYQRRFADQAPATIAARLAALRPLVSTPLGGDQTLLYAP